MPPTVDFEVYLNESVAGQSLEPEAVLARLLEMADEAGVDVSVVMPANQSARTGETYLHPDNDRVARTIRGTPRCLGCATINPTFGIPAVEELERLVREEGFRGVKLMAVLHRYNVDDTIVDPVLAKAQELGLVASIHSGPGPAHPDRIGRLAGRFPELPFIIDHMGYPDATEAAIIVAEAHANVYLGTTVLRFFSGDPASAFPEAVARAVSRIGPERIVFGSNAPEYAHSPLWTRQAIERLSLGRQAEGMIFSTNLAQLYRLTRS
jgi:predicted TIM-barrel fold metal-dependent hydrolase